MAAYPECKIADEHAAIAAAALARDSEKAVALPVDHYRTTGQFLYQALADLERPTAGRATG